MDNFIESTTYNFEDDKNKEDIENTFFGNEFHDENVEDFTENTTFQDVLKDYMSKHPDKDMSILLNFLKEYDIQIPQLTPGPDGKPIECEVRCRGCKNVEECSYIQHPEILVSRIINESTNKYTCYIGE